MGDCGKEESIAWVPRKEGLGGYVLWRKAFWRHVTFAVEGEDDEGEEGLDCAEGDVQGEHFGGFGFVRSDFIAGRGVGAVYARLYIC